MAKTQNPQKNVQTTEDVNTIPEALIPDIPRDKLPPITIEGYAYSEPDENNVVHLTMVEADIHAKLRSLIAQQIADAIAAGGGTGGGGTPAPTVQALADYNDVTNASGTFTVFSVTDSLTLRAILPAGLATNGTHLWEAVTSAGGAFSGNQDYLPTKQNTYYQGMAVGYHHIRYTYMVGGTSYVAHLYVTRPAS